ncbi:hypothetical protein [Neorhizobium galegae]|uniref:hypothetical protein n=1 Tax=Neorhizobium galegae TaxID=399 RepID=UPI0021042766|nr:hypothetical protein [Neorhizobium galegae]MCQ1833355.1 hypothetical protein [Neorhizobium galegae]
MVIGDEQVGIYIDRDFPLEDVEAIGTRLINTGALIAGYLPPSAGMLGVSSIIYEQMQGFSFLILPDRNIVSRMARIGQGTERQPFDGIAKLAVDLMAFAQALDIEIEPSIAFHELAHREGNEIAHRELSYFRGANEGQALSWIGLAQGRHTHSQEFVPAELSTENLAAPLNRWNRNYLVALKIADLELSPGTPRKRALALVEWMSSDFFVAGPALFYGLMYFSPKAAKAGLFKQLRSPSRDLAIAGIRNAAWDITHVSDFVRRVSMADAKGAQMRHIFATGDRRLSQLVKSAMAVTNEAERLEIDLFSALDSWWPEAEAKELASEIARLLKRVEDRPPPTNLGAESDPVTAWTLDGEDRVRRAQC